MVGNPVAKAAAWCRAEPGDLYAATRIARRLATPGSACSLNYGTTLQFRLSSHSDGLPLCPESPVWQVHNGVAATRALLKADMRC